MTRRLSCIALGPSLLCLLFGCGLLPKVSPEASTRLGGFHVPECMLVHPETGDVFVSNIEGAVVSDFKGNKTSLISPDRKHVTTLAEVPAPADIGIDRRRNLLHIPLFMDDQVVILPIPEAHREP